MKEDPKAARRAEILAAALDLFARQGFHNTKVSDIVEALSIAQGTFYLYFRNKLDIFSAVLDKVILGIVGVVRAEGPRTTDTLEGFRAQLSRLGNALFKVFMEDRRIARIMFQEAMGLDHAVDEKIENALELVNQYTEEYLKNGVEKGFLKKDLDTRTLAKATNGLIIHSIRDLMAAPDPLEDKTRWIDAIALLLLEGLAARPAAA